MRRLKELILAYQTPTRIEIDGGVGLHNAETLLQAGANVLVAGSSVFGAPNPREAVRQLKSIGIETLRF